MVQIQKNLASYATDVWIICMYKAVKNTKEIPHWMEALALCTGAPTVKWEDKKSCIYVSEAKIVTPIVRKINIPVFF